EPGGSKGDCMQHVHEHSVDATLQPHIKGIFEHIAGDAVVSVEILDVFVGEHQPAHVPPPQVNEWAMGIGLLIGISMVEAMRRDPCCGRVLEAADTENHKETLHRTTTAKAAMGEQSVIADVDAAAEDVRADETQDQSRPTKQPRHAGKE